VTTPPGRTSWIRVRALADAGPAGPWSATIGVAPPGVAALATATDPDGIAQVQRALLQAAAARGDVLAVVHGPADARPAALADTIARLDTDPDDLIALDHGAAYHPWVRGVDTTPRPPDGAACGVLAATALTDGAWAAPANRPIPDALAVTPTDVDAAAVLATRVNPLALGPRGLVALTARTLTPQVGGLDRIGPRRLVMLLRRLAEREGAVYAFEPDGAALRTLVRTTFTTVLNGLFTRGALAGATPDAAFDVAVPPRPQIEGQAEGQILVELRVAPARPLEFIVVRLRELTGRLEVEVSP
jgi:hypothetical protein